MQISIHAHWQNHMIPFLPCLSPFPHFLQKLEPFLTLCECHKVKLMLLISDQSDNFPPAHPPTHIAMRTKSEFAHGWIKNHLKLTRCRVPHVAITQILFATASAAQDQNLMRSDRCNQWINPIGKLRWGHFNQLPGSPMPTFLVWH